MRDSTIVIRPRKLADGRTSYVVDAGRVDGKRHRRQFKVKSEAEKHRIELREAKRSKGGLAFALDPKQIIDAKAAFDLLSPHGISLLKAAEEYIRIVNPAGGRRTVQEVINELLASKAASGKSERYLKDLRLKYKKFAAKFGELNIAEIHTADLDKWLASLSDLKSNTRFNYRRDLKTLFSFAHKRTYCAANAVEATDKPKVVIAEPQVLDLYQAMDLLWATWCYRKRFNLVPYVTLGLFAGIRSAELAKLKWGDIDLRRKLVTVRAATAKSGKRRQVELSPNLVRWLERSNGNSNDEIQIVSGGWEKHLAEVITLAGLRPWNRNTMRKSFGSYHLALHGDAGKTSTQMGHTRNDVSIFENHYKNLVTPDHVTSFWTLVPPPKKSNEKWAWEKPFECKLPGSVFLPGRFENRPTLKNDEKRFEEIAKKAAEAAVGRFVASKQTD